MIEVSGVRFKLPEFSASDFKYKFHPVFEKNWFSFNLMVDTKEIAATFGFRVKSPVHIHIGGVKTWEALADIKIYPDLLIGFEFRYNLL